MEDLTYDCEEESVEELERTAIKHFCGELFVEVFDEDGDK